MKIFPEAISLETAKEATDYPYGRRRTSMFFFVEYGGEKKGWRAVTQSIDPKTGKLNKPHASTYSFFPRYVCQDDITGHFGFLGAPQDILAYTYEPGDGNNPPKMIFTADHKPVYENAAQEFINEYWDQVPEKHRGFIRSFWTRALQFYQGEVIGHAAREEYVGVTLVYPE